MGYLFSKQKQNINIYMVDAKVRVVTLHREQYTIKSNMSLMSRNLVLSIFLVLFEKHYIFSTHT